MGPSVPGTHTGSCTGWCLDTQSGPGGGCGGATPEPGLGGGLQREGSSAAPPGGVPESVAPRDTREPDRKARPARRVLRPPSRRLLHEVLLFRFLPSFLTLLLFSKCLVWNANHLFFFFKYFKIFLHL